VSEIQPPTFSVVMPAYNAAETVGAALASVLAQTRRDFEVLVVDDGSADETLAAARRYEDDARVRVLTRDHGGPGAARNAAIEQARGAWISMLDSDDLWLPTYLAVVSEAIARQPEAVLLSTGHWALEQPPGLVRREPALDAPMALDPRALFVRLLRGNIFVNSSVTVRRSAVDEVGGCDVTLAAAVDYDLWLRIAAAGHGAVRVPGRHVIYRLHSDSIQYAPSNEVRVLENLRDVYRAVAEDWDVDDEISELANERRTAVERRIELLSGRRPFAAAALGLRRRAGSLKRRLRRRQVWYPEPPPEVASVLAGER